HRHRNAAQLLGQRLQGIELSAAPAVLDSDVLPIDEAGVAQTPTERRRQMRGIVGTAAIEITDHRHRRLLRTRRERPRRSTAEERNELASSQLTELHSRFQWLRCCVFSMMSRVRVTPLEPQTRS